MTTLEPRVRSDLLNSHPLLTTRLASVGPVWDPYTTDEEVLMQLNGNNLTMIPDNFRQQQIALANEEPLVFHH